MKQGIGVLQMILLALAAGAARAAVSYDAPGMVYAQDFNSLGITNGAVHAWTNDVTVAGWHCIVPTNIAPTSYLAWNGTGGQQGRLLDFGTSGAADRALGTQSPDVSGEDVLLGLRVTNNAGASMEQFRLQFAAEQWRVVAADLKDTLAAEFQVFDANAGSLVIPGGWTAIPGVTFTSLLSNAVSSSLNGNAATNRAVFATLVTNAGWGAGRELWIRWRDQKSVSGAARRQMMGLDDLCFVATTNGGSIAPPPFIGSISHTQVVQATTQTVTIAGSNFMTGATVALTASNAALTISDVQTPGDTTITFTLAVAGTPKPGFQGFTVTNPDGQFSTFPELLLLSIVTSLVEFAANGQVYAQDFDSLASAGTGVAWNNGATIPGWFAIAESGAARTSYNATDGTSAQSGGFLSMGRALSHPATDRALGQQNSSSTTNVTSYFGVGIRNISGVAMRSCSLSYTGELWRTPGAANTGDHMTVEFQVFDAGAGSLGAAGGWALVPSLTFTSPVPSSPAAGTAYDGNNPTNPPGNHLGLSESLAIAWGPGQELWFRWGDSNSYNNIHQHIMAADDVVFTASTNVLAPVISSVSPTQVVHGSSQTVTLAGSYFAAGATVTLATSNGAVTISNVQVLDANTITFTLAVASNVVPGSFDFVVTNPDGGSAATVNAMTALGPFAVLQNSFSPQSNRITIIWNSIPGANYAVEQATSISAGDWTNVSPTVPSQGVQTSVQVTNDAAATQLFFRVRNTNLTAVAPLAPAGAPSPFAFRAVEAASAGRVDRPANRLRLAGAAGAAERRRGPFLPIVGNGCRGKFQGLENRAS